MPARLELVNVLLVRFHFFVDVCVCVFVFVFGSLCVSRCGTMHVKAPWPSSFCLGTPKDNSLPGAPIHVEGSDTFFARHLPMSLTFEAPPWVSHCPHVPFWTCGQDTRPRCLDAPHTE